MDFSLNDDQLAVHNLAHQIFSDRVTDASLQQLDRAGQTCDEALWRILADQGLLGIALPEDLGGSGLGLVELCLLLEEQGRNLAPVPLLSSLVLGALPIARFGSHAQQRQWLAALSSGQAKLTAALAERRMNPATVTPVAARKTKKGWRLNGSCALVPDGTTADCILVPAVTDGGACVFAVDTTLPRLTLTPQNITLLGERAAQLSLNDTLLPNTALLGESGQGQAILDWMEQRAHIAQCALQVGVCEQAMRRTAAYISEREQFGVPLGSFQALALRMADSYIDVEAMRSTYWLALWRLSEDLDARSELQAATWWACSGGHRVVHTAQHLHGGIGADLDYPIHRYFLWAKHIGLMLGGAEQQLAQLGQLLAADDSLGCRALTV